MSSAEKIFFDNLMDSMKKEEVDRIRGQRCVRHGAPCVFADKETVIFECRCEYTLTESKTEGVKTDEGKLPFDLIAWDAMQGLAKVLQFGAKKYSRRNWENGIAYSRVFAAAQRHLASWFNGENIDSETSLPHIDHAMCCLMFLSAYEKRGQGEKCDDRPKLHYKYNYKPYEGHHPGGC